MPEEDPVGKKQYDEVVYTCPCNSIYTVERQL